MGTIHAKSDEGPISRTPYLNADVAPKIPVGPPPPKEKEVFLDTIKVRVDKIHVDGLGRTKDDIIEDCIKDVFKSSDFEDVVLRVHKARSKLDELGCFSNIGIYIDTSKGPDASPDGLEVTFNVKELRWVTGGIATHVGQNEGGGSGYIKLPNLFGRGEGAHIEVSCSSKKSTNFNLGFVKPLHGRLRSTLSASLFQNRSEWVDSGYKELNRGLLFDLAFNSASRIKHNLQWEATIRNLSVLSRNTAFEIREHAGLSLKSVLRHILSVDYRDDKIFPTGGGLFEMTSEVSGFGGDVGYYKNKLFLQSNFSLAEDVVLQATFNAGLMRALNNDKKISVADMCFLGGPLCLRGFEMRGVGPHSDGNALGAMAFWASGLHLFTPLPFRPGRGGLGDLFRTHFFVTAGNIGDFNFSSSPNSSQSQVLLNGIRVSYGIGIAMKVFNMARFEINYCFPHSLEKGDRARPGVQFGIGCQFL